MLTKRTQEGAKTVRKHPIICEAPDMLAEFIKSGAAVVDNRRRILPHQPDRKRWNYLGVNIHCLISWFGRFERQLAVKTFTLCGYGAWTRPYLRLYERDPSAL
jgi:hypothetical protein